MKKKSRVKKIVIPVLVVAVAGLVAYQFLKPKPSAVVYHRAMPLATMDLRNTVDVTGNVESMNSVTVNSTLDEPVSEIAVKVGDKVAEGDLLCKLDTTAIESDITAKQATIASSSKSNKMALDQANTDLYYAEWYMEHGQNADLLAAQKAVDDAQRAVDEAKYGIRTAEDNLREAKRANDKDDVDVYSDTQMNTLRDAVSTAHLSLEAAEANLASAKQKLNRAKWDADAELKELKNSVAAAQIDSDQTSDYIALNQLKEDLANCIINAPTAGTVTAVYAKEGAEAKGLLFVIENVDDLIVETTIKEFDVNTVKPGMRVIIKSDATGDEEYEGELLSVDPTSVKDDNGDTVTGSTAEYAARVKVTARDHGLRIGMNARLNIIVEEKEQRLAVLYDSVTTDAEGNSIVYVAKPQEDGTHIATAVTVETGMETDLYLEVAGDGLAEGDMILQDVSLLYDGMPVNLTPDMGGMGAMGAGGGMGGGGMTVRVG